LSIENKTLRAALWSAIGTWIRRVLAFAIFAVIVRVVTKDTVGLVATAMLYIGFMELFTRQGMGMAIIQKKSPSQEFMNSAFYLSLASTIALALLTLGLAPLLASFLDNPALTPILAALSVSLPIGAFAIIPSALLSKAFDFRKIAFQTSVGTAAGGAVAIPLALGGFEAWALVAQTVVTLSATSLLAWLNVAWRPSLSIHRGNLAELARFSVKICSGNLVAYAAKRADQVFIAIFLTPVDLGVYALASKLNDTTLALVDGPKGDAVLPAFSKIREDSEKLTRGIQKIVRLNAYITLPIFSGAAIVATPLITTLFSAKWTDASQVYSILSLGMIPRSLFFYNYFLLVSVGLAGKAALVQMTNAILTILAVVIGLQWGLAGIAYGMLASSAIVNIGTTVYSSRALNIPSLPIFVSTLRPVFVTALMSICLMASSGLFERFDGIFALLAPVAIGAAVYAGSALILFRRDSDELLHTLRNLIRSRRD